MLQKYQRTLIFVCMAMLSGCINVETFSEKELPIDIPNEQANQPHNGWLADFDSKRLNELVSTALENNPDLQIARSLLNDADLIKDTSSNARLPSANLRLNNSRSKSVASLNGVSKASELGIEVSWEADIWGKLTNTARADNTRYQASQADFEAARLSLAGNVCKAWFSILSAKQRMTLAINETENFIKVKSLTESAYKKGIVTALDVQLASADAASAIERKAARASEYDDAIRELKVLLGQYPDSKFTEISDLPELPPIVPQGVDAKLLERRPDLRSAKLTLIASDKDTLAAKRAMLPSLQLTGSIGRASEELSDLNSDGLRVWSILGGITQPIFQGKQLRNNTRA
jgi:NodT family efflux transporter outer membrane factor (OMF) lipoprotein